MAALALALLPAVDTDLCDNPACREAQSPREACECRQCDGRGHGVPFRDGYHAARLGIRTRMIATGDVFLGAAADDDDDELMARIVRRPIVLDEEDMF